MGFFSFLSLRKSGFEKRGVSLKRGVGGIFHRYLLGMTFEEKVDVNVGSYQTETRNRVPSAQETIIGFPPDPPG